MFYSAELGFLRDILSKYHLETTVFSGDDNISKISSSNFFINQYGNLTFNKIVSDVVENTIYKLTDTLYCNYYFFMLPKTDGQLFLAIGPYLKEEVSRSDILELAEKFNLEPKATKSLEYFFSNTPLIPDESYIFAIIGTFADKIWGGPKNYTVSDIKGDNIPLFQNFDFKKNETQYENAASYNMRIMEQRYSYENELMNAVSQGLTHKVELLLSSFSKTTFEKRTPDTLRNSKNYLIIMNTLLRKSAENGGVHPIYIDSVSSDFAKRIEALTTVLNIEKFMSEMFKTYCNLVKNHSINRYSPSIQKTIVAIDSDLTADLSLKAMAELNNVSAGYLSALFRKETGQTLTDFVNSRRIKMAKKLLKTTNLQVQTIAQHCGILDVQYFSKMFKAKSGLTPKEYREKAI